MSLLNWKNCRRYALKTASTTRHHRFTRVSSEFKIRIENHIKEKIEQHIRSMPSVGQTIR